MEVVKWWCDCLYTAFLRLNNVSEHLFVKVWSPLLSFCLCGGGAKRASPPLACGYTKRAVQIPLPAVALPPIYISCPFMGVLSATGTGCLYHTFLVAHYWRLIVRKGLYSGNQGSLICHDRMLNLS